MADSVYKVVELVGSSAESWEKAAAAAVKQAAKSLRDLRIAEVVQLDMQLADGKVQAYRAKVKLSFKYEGGGSEARPGASRDTAGADADGIVASVEASVTGRRQPIDRAVDVRRVVDRAGLRHRDTGRNEHRRQPGRNRQPDRHVLRHHRLLAGLGDRCARSSARRPRRPRCCRPAWCRSFGRGEPGGDHVLLAGRRDRPQ